MKKRVLAMVLAAVMAFSMAGCSSSSSQEQASKTEETAEQSEAKQPEASAVGDTSSAGETEASAAPSAEGIKIGLTFLNLDNPFFVAFKASIEAACQEAGVELIFSDSQGTSEGQIQAMEDFISMGVNAIIITPQDGEAVLPQIKEAREKGIYVVCHTIMPEEYDAYVGAEEHDLGYCLGVAAGEWIKENLGDQEKVVAATLNYDIAPTVIPRKEGIIDGVNSVVDNVEFVATETAGETAAGMAAAETFLTTYPDLQVLLGINDGGALGAYEAFMDAGKTGDDILIGGIDATDEGLAKVAEGGIYRMTVSQNPDAMGRKCVEDCLGLINGEEIETEYYVDRVAVTKDNVDEYR